VRGLSVSVNLATSDGYLATQYEGNTTYLLEIRANYFAMGFVGFYLNIFRGKSTTKCCSAVVKPVGITGFPDSVDNFSNATAGTFQAPFDSTRLQTMCSGVTHPVANIECALHV